MLRADTGAKMKIGLFYGSTTCYTEIVAEKIQALIGAELVELNNIKQVPLSAMADYDILILGLSTWDFGEIQEDWEAHWDDISQVNLNNKIIAIYGMGDQIGYAEWFIDAVGMLHDVIAAQDAVRIGYWPVDGYEFIASKALTEDGKFFVGLALDDENQYDQTDERLNSWVSQVLQEIAERL